MRKKTLLIQWTMLAGLVLVPFSLTGQVGRNSVITTVAGASWTFPGDGAPAKNAPLSQIYSISTDRDGNPIFADPGNHVVSRLNPNGTITVLAGNGVGGFSGDEGPARSASLNNPVDAVMDKNGNLYISDSFNYRIRLVTPDGNITTWVTNVGTGSRLALDRNNTLYFTYASLGKCYIYRDTTDSDLSVFAGSGTCGHAGDDGAALDAAIDTTFYGDAGLAVDSTGNVYLAEYAYIRKISRDGSKIVTIAGNGRARYSGDNGPAVSASLKGATSLVFDSVGNLFVTDTNNYIVRRISPDGIITTVAGTPGKQGDSGDGGDAASARFFAPFGLGIDGRGSLFVSDTGNFRIRRITGGIIDTVGGNGLFRIVPDGTPATQSFLFGPYGLASDSAGNLLMGLYNGSQVGQISPDGSFHIIAGSGTKGAGSVDGSSRALTAWLGHPEDIAEDQQGNIYFTDSFASVVYKISGGILSVFAGKIFQVGSGGDDGPATDATFLYPYGIAIDSSGNVYISDPSAHVVRRVSPDGKITRFAGNGTSGSSGDGGPANTAMLKGPYGIAFDRRGNLLICDSDDYRIRAVSPAGIISTVMGDGQGKTAGDGGQALQASSPGPLQVAVDPAGNIYFIEYARIRRIDTSGVITTIAGQTDEVNSGDGGPAGQASVNVNGLGFDAAGNLYLASTDDDKIRKILASEPSFTVPVTSLSFSGVSGGAAADPQTIPVGGALAGLQVAVVSDSPWLQTQSNQGATPFNLAVIADPARLASGTYRGMLSLSRVGAASPFAKVAVTFTVSAVVPPNLAVEPGALQISVTQGGSPQTQSFRVLNTGSGTLNFSIATSGIPAASIGLSAQTGAAVAGSPIGLVVTVDPGNLSSGTISANLKISSSTGQTANVPLTISVAPRPQRMALSQHGLLFTAVQGGGVTPPQSLSVLNIGSGSFTWSASAVLLSGGPAWFSVTPASDSSSAGSSSGQVTVAVDPSQLSAPGVYYGFVRITSPGTTNAPQDAEVVLNLLPGGATPDAALSSTGLVFSAPAGGDNPSSQTFTITNLNASAVQFYVNTAAFGLTWLQAVPNTATIPAGASQTITVQPKTDGLAAGPYHGTLTIQFQDPAAPAQLINPQLVNVLLVATPSASGGSKGGRSAPGCTPSQLFPVFTSLPPSFAAPASWPIPLEARVIDDCGAPLTTGSVVVNFDNGDPGLSMLPLNDGRWQATWYGKNPSAKTFFVYLRADQSAPNLTAKVKYTATLQTNENIPAVTPGGVNSAGMAPSNAPLAPGSIISIAGASFSAGQTSAAQLPLGTNLGGTQVLMAGRLLPLIYSSGNRISAIVPFDLDVDAQYTMFVGRGSAVSANETVAIAAAQPSVFLVDSSGDADKPLKLWTQLTAGTPIDPTSMAPASPVKAGDRLLVYCTGLGAVEGTQDASMPAPTTPSKLKNPVSVQIGTATAQITSAGLVPGLAGIYQVQVTVPNGIPPGDKIPLVLSTLGQSSVPVNLSVR